VISPKDESPRPDGIGVSALVMCVLALASELVDGLQITGGAPAAGYAARLPALFSYSVLFGAELFAIWNYWKGKNWARRLALIASFLFVAKEISGSIDQEGGPIQVMNHPLRFLSLATAAFLLYWLNTGSLRAWFKKSSTAADLIAKHLTGKLCIAVVKPVSDHGWQLAFEHDAEVTLNCPWRLVLDDNLVFTSTASVDSGTEQFDGDEPRQILQNLRVKTVRVSSGTSDLFIAFEMGIELQTWSVDANSEQWRFSDASVNVVADSGKLNSEALAKRISTEDSSEND